MLLDENLVLCEKTNFFGTAGTGLLIGDVIDLGQFDSGKPKLDNGVPTPDNIATNPNFGGIMPMTLLLRITEDMAGGTTVNFNLYSSEELDVENIGALGAVIHWRSGSIARANVTVGREFTVPFPWDNAQTVKRYLQMTVDRGGDSTAGKCSAMLIAGAQQWQPLHANYRQL